MSLTPTDWLYLPKSHCGAGIVNGSATKWDEAVGGRGRGEEVLLWVFPSG